MTECIEVQSYCEMCGYLLKSSAIFCGSCGFKLSDTIHQSPDIVSVVSDVPPDAINSIPVSPVHYGRLYTDSLTDRMGLERIEGFSIGHLFSETFRMHTEDEFEERLMAGTSRTTPSLADVESNWPTPWVFGRLLMMTLLVTGILWVTWSMYQNTKLIPGLIIAGAFAAPLAAAMFFYEINIVRNVSLVLVSRLIFIGGVLSLLLTLVLGEMTSTLTWWLGASAAGFVEETAKLGIVVILVRGTLAERYPYILNGMLFGAAVGAGFAAFESAGYAFEVALVAGDKEMLSNIVVRGLLAPFGHVVWTAIAAGALWRVKLGNPLNLEMLQDKRFYAPLLMVMLLHFTWNTPFDPPFNIKYLGLGVIAWIIAIALIQAGIKQISEAKIQQPSG